MILFHFICQRKDPISHILQEFSLQNKYQVLISLNNALLNTKCHTITEIIITNYLNIVCLLTYFCSKLHIHVYSTNKRLLDLIDKELHTNFFTIITYIAIDIMRSPVMRYIFLIEHAVMWELLNKARVFIQMIELQVVIGSIRNKGNILTQVRSHNWQNK